jgi:uncharacterized membrane protein YccC
MAGRGVWTKVRTVAGFPVAMGAAMLLGVAVGGNSDLMLGVFVLVMFVAMLVRRLGAAFFFLGFMGWIGYFFASFMHAQLSMMPFLMSAVGIASAWVLLLSLTVLRINPSRAVQRTVRSFDARARALLRACAELLDAAGGGGSRKQSRLRRAVHSQQQRLVEAALMVEGWLAEPGALPAAGSAQLRRDLINAQQALDAIVETTRQLVEANGEQCTAAATIAKRLAYRDDSGAMRAIRDWRKALAHAEPGFGNKASEIDARRAAYRFADAARIFVRLARAARHLDPNANLHSDNDAEGFEPAVNLAMGNLPGSSSVARDVSARGTRWNPLARLDMTTRQAIQVAVAGGLAIVAGRALSPARYYWAVIAAFIMFSGTATRSETLIKGINRVFGTVLGLVVAIVLAEVNAGHPIRIILTILASMFLGLYLIRISYAYMIFFITIMVAQLYTVFQEFTPGLLVVRLEETAIGAALGFLVAMFFVPLSTRDTVRSARQTVLGSLAQLLNAMADQLQTAAKTNTPDSGDEKLQSQDLYALSRELDDHVRRFELVAKPLTGPLLGGRSFVRARHRLGLYSAAARDVRAVVVEIGTTAATSANDRLADVCHYLATAATGLADDERGDRGRQDTAVTSPLTQAGNILSGCDPSAAPVRGANRITQSLRQLLYVLQSLHSGTRG